MLKKYLVLCNLIIFILSPLKSSSSSVIFTELFKGEFTKADSLINSLQDEGEILYYKFLKETYLLNHYEVIPNKEKVAKKKKKALGNIEYQLKKNLAIHEKADLFFFKGCILSYSGIIATQQGSFFSGLSLAFEGVDALDVAIELNKVHYDALMMREIYNFYKAKKLKFLFHSKEKIIKRLLKYYPKTDIIKPLAASSLIIILRNEGLFKKALKVADEVTSRYGNTRYYLRPIIKLDILAGNYKEAITKSRVLIELLKSDVKYQSFNLYKAYYQLAKASYLAEDMETFKSAVSKLEDISLSSSEFDKMGDRPEFLREMMNGEYEAESL